MLCAKCGNERFTKAGRKLDTAGTWQMHLCMGCGHRQKGQLIKAAEV